MKKGSAKSIVLITAIVFVIVYGLIGIGLNLPYGMGVAIIIAVLVLLVMVRSSLKGGDF